MFERYSERARRAIFHAKNESLARAAQEIDTSDLVLGLCRDAHQPNCPFAKLHELEADFRVLLGADAIPPVVPENEDIALSKTSKMALAYADREAALDRRYSIGSDHILRGVLRTKDETAVKLIGAGYSLAAMRAASKRAHMLSPDKPAPLRWRLRTYSKRLFFIAVMVLTILALFYLHSQN
jgi:ATP-dependent Clp protease ATP-binding subunit ClpA